MVEAILHHTDDEELLYKLIPAGKRCKEEKRLHRPQLRHLCYQHHRHQRPTREPVSDVYEPREMKTQMLNLGLFVHSYGYRERLRTLIRRPRSTDEGVEQPGCEKTIDRQTNTIN